MKSSKDVTMFVSIFFYSSNVSFSIIKIKLLALGQYINKYHMKGRFTFERIHYTKEQIYFYERADKHKAKERLFESLK